VCRDLPLPRPRTRYVPSETRVPLLLPFWPSCLFLKRSACRWFFLTPCVSPFGIQSPSFLSVLGSFFYQFPPPPGHGDVRPWPTWFLCRFFFPSAAFRFEISSFGLLALLVPRLLLLSRCTALLFARRGYGDGHRPLSPTDPRHFLLFAHPCEVGASRFPSPGIQTFPTQFESSAGTVLSPPLSIF